MIQYILIGRHGKKQGSVDIPGSEEDKQIDLSEKGKKSLMNKEKRI